MPLPSGEIFGRELAQQMQIDLQERTERIVYESGRMPLVALFNANPGHEPSKKYIMLKKNMAVKIGLNHYVDEGYTADRLPDLIDDYNSYPNTCGIVVQLPLKEGEEEKTDDILHHIAPQHDVDGLRGLPGGPSPATPSAILHLMEGNGIDPDREHFALFGTGRLVGGPIKTMLLNGGAKVTAVDVHTPPYERLQALHEATVIISAMGRPGSITPELFGEEGLSHPKVLIDAGTAEQKGKISGDVSDAMREAALDNGWGITARHGGVGPLTVVSLMRNVVESAEHKFNIAV